MDPASLLPDAGKLGQGGYYIPGGGSQSANFQTLFMRVNPKVIVNDNVSIKSEWWIGDPVFGIFGNGTPASREQRQWLSSFTRGAPISAQRFWGEVSTDIGMVQVGRAPLDWGLGLVYSAGNGMWDRYPSTGDLVRMVTRFGAFSFIPTAVHYSAGNTIGGACYVTGGVTCSPTLGSGDVYDLSIAFKYDNTDEDFEAGVTYIKRIINSAQDPFSGYLGVGTTADAAQVTGGSNINVWDLYGKKKLGPVHLGIEVPIVTGHVSGFNYSTFAVAGEVKWQVSDAWELFSKGGYVPGQGNYSGTNLPSLSAFYLHPNYRLGMIMFSYQLAAFGGPQTQNNSNLSGGALSSPFYNPISNAYYGMLGAGWNISKFRLHTGVIAAAAPQVARSGENFFNHWERRFVAAVADQKNFLGVETDLGATYRWDDHLDIRFDMGLWMPGDFYAFSNTANVNKITPIFGAQLGLGIQF